jgi:hypothetical protein
VADGVLVGAIVLILVAAYAFICGFGLLELAVLRRLGGITAIVSGVILLLPTVKAAIAKRSDGAVS